MSRYIDAERIEPFLKREEWGTPDERWRPESEFGRYIDAIPTADVAEIPNEEPYLERMMDEVKRSHEDEEVAHKIADSILCNLLTELGYERLVKAFDDVWKWYA